MSATITNITTNPDTGMTTFVYNGTQYSMQSTALDIVGNYIAPSTTDMQAYAQKMEAAKTMASMGSTSGGKRSRKSRKSRKSKKSRKTKKSRKSKKSRKARR